ncbi:MAG: hypothetical protein IKT39_04995 [Clostridia bacterium]|nr:hypothetical protein [Clostridia bacterium]MBR6523947.1 hypothetical protein [Clostridia bacterium]
MKKIAVIDLGSNSVRMSIFGYSENAAPKTLAAYRSTIRLSEGMSQDMCLRRDAQMRAVAALGQYKKIIDAEGVTKVCTVATAAVRKAKNKLEFLELVRELTGIEIQVIDGAQEAALDALAIKRSLGCEKGVICDIGGGSTELIGIGEVETPPSVSIPFGSRGISEMFFANGETAEAIAAAEQFVQDKFDAEKWLDEYCAETVIGIGGTLRATAKYDLGDCGKGAVESYRITPRRMSGIFGEILSASTEDRKKMAGIGEERADIILGGLIFIKCLADRLSPKSFVIADVGVREGVLFDYIENHKIL